jgi:excisionase family DNA binding protein
VDAVLTICEVGQVLRRSIWFVQGEIANGRLKHARVGGLIRVTSAQLAEYLEECSEKGQEKVRARKARRAETAKAHKEVVHA